VFGLTVRVQVETNNKDKVVLWFGMRYGIVMQMGLGLRG